MGDAHAKSSSDLANQIDLMKKAITIIAAVFSLAALPLYARADDASVLNGKWVAKRTNSQGEAIQQVLEIKKDKFTFKILQDADQVAIYAQGDVKLEQLGPFKVARFSNIQGGRSAADLQPVDDEHVLIYTLSDNELTMASNFDKERSEPASAIKYHKAAAEESKGLVIEKIVLHTTPQSADWYLCFDATAGGTTRRFNIPDKTWSKDEVTITTDLTIPKVSKGQTCNFVLKLDDVAGDECSDEMDNKSTGSFTVTESGSQAFKPENDWRYTIYWRLK